MHRSEAEELRPCAGCGNETSPTERAYCFGHEELLCFSCAELRRGTYDEARDQWTVAPDVSDLLTERQEKL